MLVKNSALCDFIRDHEQPGMAALLPQSPLPKSYITARLKSPNRQCFAPRVFLRDLSDRDGACARVRNVAASKRQSSSIGRTQLPLSVDPTVLLAMWGYVFRQSLTCPTDERPQQVVCVACGGEGSRKVEAACRREWCQGVGDVTVIELSKIVVQASVPVVLCDPTTECCMVSNAA